MPGSYSSFGGPRQANVSQSHFAMVPRSDVPRSAFRVRSSHKTTFDAGLLIPMYLNEVLPGDSFNLTMTAFARLSPAVFPIMDNLYMDTFFFFVPNRLVWDNWQRFMGERLTPEGSIDFTVPVSSPADGYALNTVEDYFGLPISEMTTSTFSHSCLPIRAYKLIYNEWFRDQNLETPLTVSTGDGPDAVTTGLDPVRRGKRHDYFTSCLPWPQKGTAVTLPLGTLAPVVGIGIQQTLDTGPDADIAVRESRVGGGANVTYGRSISADAPGGMGSQSPSVTVRVDANTLTPNPMIYADLSAATASTINALRQAFQVQRLLERDARGGTRYTEILRSHFGVVSPDARLQRPEYLGGSSTPVHINPVAQTSETSESGTPLGNLAGVGTAVHSSGFSQSFTEHGFIIGIVNVRSDLTYQQGLRRMWSRSTRYDFYWPAFAHLGEQAVLRQELYCTGVDADDTTVFGYQERWAEYRYHPSQITGKFRSGITGTLDGWHLAQEFETPPTLSAAFIREFPPMDRVLAAGEESDGQQFLFDSVFDARIVRPMPTYSVPGFIDRF